MTEIELSTAEKYLLYIVFSSVHAFKSYIITSRFTWYLIFVMICKRCADHCKNHNHCDGLKQASLAAEGGSLEGLDFMGTPPPKVFWWWKLLQTVLKFPLKVFHFSEMKLNKKNMTQISCVQIPSPIFSDIPEDLFTTLSHLR